MKNKFLSVGFTAMMIIGIALFIYGCTIKIPSEKLSYYGYNNTSKIEEYVGGDAYNYIIGAEIVGSKIVAAKPKEQSSFVSGCLWRHLAVLLLHTKKENTQKRNQKKLRKL